MKKTAQLFLMVLVLAIVIPATSVFADSVDRERDDAICKALIRVFPDYVREREGYRFLVINNGEYELIIRETDEGVVTRQYGGPERSYDFIQFLWRLFGDANIFLIAWDHPDWFPSYDPFRNVPEVEPVG